MTNAPLYDSIGAGYASQRRPDPRVEAQIHDALGDAQRILNVGAGTGNYEPLDRVVVAIEPSREMHAQRHDAAPAAQAIAEHLPVRSNSFDATLCMLTIHHWSDREGGLRELCRVAPKHVALVYDPTVSAEFWLADYFPTIKTAAWEVNAPTAEHLAAVMAIDDVRPVQIPPDCTDGFTGAYWNRPHYYLDPLVQQGMSTLARLTDAERAAGTAALQNALHSGEWDQRHGELRDRDTFDIGYRLVIGHS